MSAIQDYMLPNGMTILTWQQPHLHGLEMGLYLKGGPLYETEECQGVCHLLMHLCDRGLGGLNHDMIQRILNRFGTELRSTTYTSAMEFRLKTLPRFLDDALDLFLRFFSDIPWTSEQVDKAKQIVLRQIEEDDDDFRTLVDRTWRETPGGVFPLKGTAERIVSLDDDTIRNWQRLVFQPQNACLVLTGNFSQGMERAVVEAFAELTNYTSEPPFEQNLPMDFCMRDKGSDVVYDCEGGPASVEISFDIDEENVFPLAAEVLSAITAGNVDSLLYQALRDDEALVADIDSCIQQTGSFHRMIISYDVRQECLAESLRKVFTYLHRLTMYVRPIRLNQVQAQFTASNAMVTDDVSELNELAGWAWVADDVTRADLDAQTSTFADLTAEELLDAAQTVFRPDNLCISVQCDSAVVTDDLDALFAELRGML